MSPDDLKTLTDKLICEAVAHYWGTLTTQSGRQNSDKADVGNRTAVTGGGQMDGFANLFATVAMRMGIPVVDIYMRSRVELPGYYRPTKRWDLVIVKDGHLLAAIELKSQAGPSFGNNFNNRTEEVIGSAVDLWTAFAKGAYTPSRIRPWVGWLMLLEECAGSTEPVTLKCPHFAAFPEFENSSYADRYGILVNKLKQEGLYTETALLLSNRVDGRQGVYRSAEGRETVASMVSQFARHIQYVVANGC